jgi:ribose-phosphate pyrophosphokinase
MKPILFNLYGDPLIAKTLGYEAGTLHFHTFPDGETSVVIETDIDDREIIFLATLDRPNTKILPLIFATETARALGARKIGLVAPYLSYMREDKQFQPGESITARYFSKLLSSYVDWLITIDPHLHRIHQLSEVYSIPTKVLHAAEPVTNWIKEHVKNPLVIGPDQESEQWVAGIAEKLNAPYLLLSKNRKGDRSIEVILPSIEDYRHCTPILIDDIISSGRTLIEPIRQIIDKGANAPICIGTHAVFADHAYEDLLAAGAAQVVTCNTIQHVSNGIDVGGIIAEALACHELRKEHE